MISVTSLYQDVVKDDANRSENGDLSYERFNRLLKRAELFLLKYLTGDLIVDANDFPSMNSSQKNKDYLKRFIVKHKANGDFVLPDDYFGYENLYKIGSYVSESECDQDSEASGCDAYASDSNQSNIVSGCNTPIVILDGQAFYSRCESSIKSLRPSVKKPIAKIVDNKIEILPSDIGSVCLEYVRYPKFGFIKTKKDPVYNDVVPDESASNNCEWDEWAREYLIWFMVNKFATHTRERALKEVSAIDKPRG